MSACWIRRIRSLFTIVLLSSFILTSCTDSCENEKTSQDIKYAGEQIITSLNENGEVYISTTCNNVNYTYKLKLTTDTEGVPLDNIEVSYIQKGDKSLIFINDTENHYSSIFLFGTPQELAENFGNLIVKKRVDDDSILSPDSKMDTLIIIEFVLEKLSNVDVKYFKEEHKIQIYYLSGYKKDYHCSNFTTIADLIKKRYGSISALTSINLAYVNVSSSTGLTAYCISENFSKVSIDDIKENLINHAMEIYDNVVEKYHNNRKFNTTIHQWDYSNWTSGYENKKANIIIDLNNTACFGVPFENFGITFTLIPGGMFQMGDIQGVGNSDELPVHMVSLGNFEMSVFEITQSQYEAIMRENPSHFRGEANLPVEQVSWYDAILFCNKLSEQLGFEKCYNETTLHCDFSKNGFRLPTEAEWEYACRAGTNTIYYCCSDYYGSAFYETGYYDSKLPEFAWYSRSGGKTQPGGLKKPNAWGLYDMLGNVNEWCYDWYGNYESLSVSNPTGPETGSQRIFRGGAHGYGVSGLRVSLRHHCSPDIIFYSTGIRIVRGPVVLDY